MKTLPETACEFLTAAFKGIESAALGSKAVVPPDQAVVSVTFTWEGEDYIISLAKAA